MPIMEILIIASILLILPLIPAFIIYKFLPAKTVVKGPFKGLDKTLRELSAVTFYWFFFVYPLSIRLERTYCQKSCRKLKKNWRMKKQKIEGYRIIDLADRKRYCRQFDETHKYYRNYRFPGKNQRLAQYFLLFLPFSGVPKTIVTLMNFKIKHLRKKDFY